MIGTCVRACARVLACAITCALALALALLLGAEAKAQQPAKEPVKLGFSMALTGGVAPNGKQILAALELWRGDVNAKGGLLGRPVELVYYDDQSNPANVPAIYTKLITVDKVDLLVGPYATNMVAPAMPVIMQHNKVTIGILAIGISQRFKYPNYFSMVPVGTDGIRAFSRGFFEVVAVQKPKPKTVAIIAADAEFAKTAADGAADNAKAVGLEVIYNRAYPPATTDFAPVVRAAAAANADVLFVASYPPDTVGIVRAANEIGITPKVFGGTMIGLLSTPIKMQLGPLINGIMVHESFVRAPAFDFPGTNDLLDRYQKKVAGQGIDPLGHGFVPFGYAAGQILAKAVQETRSLDHGRIGDYIRTHTFETVVGPITYKNGEWEKPRMVFTQFQNITGNGLDQFHDAKHQVILWPAELKTGTMIYPYPEARKK